MKLSLTDGEKKTKANFTYDYDGNIVVVQNVKPDRLPSNILHLKFNLYFLGINHTKQKKK